MPDQVPPNFSLIFAATTLVPRPDDPKVPCYLIDFLAWPIRKAAWKRGLGKAFTPSSECRTMYDLATRKSLSGIPGVGRAGRRQIKEKLASAGITRPIQCERRVTQLIATGELLNSDNSLLERICDAYRQIGSRAVDARDQECIQVELAMLSGNPDLLKSILQAAVLRELDRIISEIVITLR